MKTALVLLLLVLAGTTARAAVPATGLYPFPGMDLAEVRAKTKAEGSPDSKELTEAWRLYRELQGSWMTGAPKPRPETIARLDRLKGELAALPKPRWLLEVMNSPQSGQSRLADKVGDPVFEQQKATPEYQRLKALAIVCLSEHELDRPGSPQQAGKYLTALAITHPWDWQVHGLYSRLLIDAQLPGPAWAAAKQSLFLNPEPDLNDLKFFAFIGSLTAKDRWPEIQEAIRQAAMDDKVAELAIVESNRLFDPNTKATVVAPKGP